ncbi:MAG: hypothetical protein SA378_01135 [Sedimentibacter sp.]|uniref:hypothetical protein n=1 Tax=Sedimentibacter sp. TaxID=1960295 RepID=UPI002980D481|nr:hypothetical protein [Sedimentibacter sp.]MDW5298735.1 hypothetical protein [Sedimentibacter sp.]
MKYCPYIDDECINEDLKCSECPYANFENSLEHPDEDSEIEDDYFEEYDPFDEIGDIAIFINFMDENNNDYLPLEESELPF